MEPDFTKMPAGLVPAIVQDALTGAVLMMGYMNADALKKTRDEGKVTFFSRSKGRLWTKGESSGNFLAVDDIRLDCDNDTLLISAYPEGLVCHKGTETCFGRANATAGFLGTLEDTIRQRKDHPSADSYVSKLLSKGINKVAQKVGEEATELVIEAKDANKDLFLNEAADLLFHYLVLLTAKECSLTEVLDILQERNAKNIEIKPKT